MENPVKPAIEKVVLDSLNVFSKALKFVVAENDERDL